MNDKQFKSTHNIKFSIILPVYNREKIIPFAIQSVLAQDYNNWELIIVDDNSTDDSRAICEEFAIKDFRIKVYAQSENKGASAARNLGLHYSNADYILFLDSDDRIKENALSKLASICVSYTPEVLVYGIERWWIPSDTICDTLIDKEIINSFILPQHINICEHTEYFLQPYIWNKCYKQSIIVEHSINFEERRRVWEDNTFLIQCFDKCNIMYIIQDQLYIPGNYPEIDHLSSHVDETVILQYIDGYKDNLRQFGDRYDFNNDYTPRRYFEVINDQLRQLLKKTSTEDFKNFLNVLVNEQAVMDWVSAINPKDKSETELMDAYLSKNVDRIYCMYQNALVEKKNTEGGNNNFFNRIKHQIIKHIKR